MNALIDAFLELPAWQGIALIAAAVAIQTALCLAVVFVMSHVTRHSSHA
jgi:hypothetical protein